jgi:hypothetical protein
VKNDLLARYPEIEDGDIVILQVFSPLENLFKQLKTCRVAIGNRIGLKFWREIWR